MLRPTIGKDSKPLTIIQVHKKKTILSATFHNAYRYILECRCYRPEGEWIVVWYRNLIDSSDVNYYSSFSFWDRQQTSLLSFDPPNRQRLESSDCVNECSCEMTVIYEKEDRLLYGICRQHCSKRCNKRFSERREC